MKIQRTLLARLIAACAAVVLAGLAPPALVAQDKPADNYVIGPRDVITITVFGEPEISKAYTVDADGMFSFKWLGRVKATGLTVPQLEAALKKALIPDYMTNPQLSITIDQFRSQQILVMGEVRMPAAVSLSGGVRLLDALLRAGGPLPTASGDVVVSHSAKDSASVRIDLAKLQSGDPSVNIELLDGDKVYVPRADTVFVFGEVKNPGGFPTPKNTTVLQVLSMAGGMTPDANKNNIRITRSGEAAEIKNVKLTDIVRPGDVIVVKPRIF